MAPKESKETKPQSPTPAEPEPEPEGRMAPEGTVDGPADHPFVLAVARMMEHLAGQPKDGYLQPLYNDVRVQYRKLLGHPEPIPDHVQEAKRAAREDNVHPLTAQEQRERATRVPLGTRAGSK